MEFFSSQWKAQIADQLNKLAFDDVAKLVETAEQVEYRINPAVKAGIFMDCPVIPHCDGEIALFIVQEKEDLWKISSMTGSVQMGSERDPEGFTRVSKAFFASDGPLPAKDEMIRHLSFLVQAEQHKELIYHQGCLQNDFDHLGFVNSAKMDWDIRAWDHFSYVRTIEPIGEGPDLMRFEFRISPSHFVEPIHISAVTGSLYINGAGPKDGKPTYEKTFLLKDGPLPSKMEITLQVLAQLKSDKALHDKICRQFQIGKADGPGNRRQRHLGI